MVVVDDVVEVVVEVAGIVVVDESTVVLDDVDSGDASVGLTTSSGPSTVLVGPRAGSGGSVEPGLLSGTKVEQLDATMTPPTANASSEERALMSPTLERRRSQRWSRRGVSSGVSRDTGRGSEPARAGC